jgi:hypothetical protein
LQSFECADAVLAALEDVVNLLVANESVLPALGRMTCFIAYELNLLLL